MIALRYFAPSMALRPFLSSYYVFSCAAPLVRDMLRAELPQVRFRLHGTGRFTYDDGRIDACPAAMLTGATSGPILFDAEGPLTIVGAGILPAGWAALFGLSAAELADRTVDLDDIYGRLSIDTFERLLTATSDAATAEALDDMFLSVLALQRAVPFWFTRATDAWLTGSDNPQVDALQAATGVSARQLERLSKRIYGASPKLLARKYRALQAAVRIVSGNSHAWADAAGDGFYDQSHFIREFKQFVGQTPNRFVTQAAPLARLTIAKRQELPTLPKLALLS